ncbi:MAG: aromatic amino acid transport family protein [Candidatus Portnoybacteria bacterium]|nr:aromatic amino acid transport family protein [Candidatus Portnoybacteria bacterium]
MLKLLKAVSIFVGTVIGAGIFGVPYVINKSGVVPGFFYFLILGGVVLLIHLFFGEAFLRTKESCRLPGLAQKYLGSWGKILVMISVVLGLVGALLAYLILSGDFLRILFAPFSNLSAVQLATVFWVVMSYLIFRGIKLIASIELLTNIIFFLTSAVLFSFCLPRFNLQNLAVFNLSNAFLPFGVILFSLIGWSAIPEIADFFKVSRENKKVKKTIILATAITVPFYLIFTSAILGVVGGNVSPDTISSLVPFLNPKLIFLGILAALVTLADSVLVLGLHLKNTFVYDLKLSNRLATAIACGVPFLLFLIGFRDFIGTIGFVGTVVGVVEGAVIVLIFKRAKKLGNRQPEYSFKVPSLLLYLLIAVLVLGAISQFLL